MLTSVMGESRQIKASDVVYSTSISCLDITTYWNGTGTFMFSCQVCENVY